MQFAPLLANPQFAGAMGKIIKVGNQRAIQTSDGDVNMVVNNKFLVTVNGSAPAAAKLAYAQAVDVTNSPRCSRLQRPPSTATIVAAAVFGDVPEAGNGK